MKRFAKLLHVFLCTVLLFVGMSTKVSAAEVVATGSCGDNATWTFTDDGIFRIEGHGRLYDYAFLNQPDYAEYSHLVEKVIISDGITYLGDYAFVGMQKLTDITIPESVLETGEYVFDLCSKLTTLKLPSKISEIKQGMFLNCYGMISIDLPASVTKIDKDAFGACNSLKNITLPTGLKSIGDEAFSYCSSLETVVFPDGLESIGFNAFNYCTSLQSAILPDSLKSLGDSAFVGCTNLESIIFPDSIKEIQFDTCKDCSKLKNVKLPAELEIIYDGCFANTGIEKIVIPSSVKAIKDGRGAADEYGFFSVGGRLDQSIINAASINLGAFDTCTNLKEVVIPKSLVYIGAASFIDCDAITTVYYEGSKSDWEKINFRVGNDALLNANIIFNSNGPSTPADAITLSLSSTNVEVGNSYKLIASVSPSTADQKVTWASSNEKVATVDSEGNVKGIKTGSATITATTSNGKTAKCTVTVIFTDVPALGVYYSAPVYWAVNKAITNGYTDDDGFARTFKPQNNCTREAVVTFLWRLAGKPNPKSMKSPFSDVQDSSKYYYKAVLWAAEKGITGGYKDGTFKPSATCLREHVVTFLYRYAGTPDPGVTKNPFNDVKTSDYYYKAALWANAKGIAKGYTSGEHAGGFGPKLDCLREHVVTFLYRYAK